MAVNIADRLAARDRDVLLVDITGQDGVRTAMGRDGSEATPDLTTVLRGGGELSEATITPGNITVLPAPGEPEVARDLLSGGPKGLTRLARHVVYPARERYDHVIVDTPPEVSVLSDAAIAAADQVVLPTGLNHADLAGLARTIEQQLVPIRRERPLPIAAIVPNRLRGTAEEQRSLEELQSSPLGDRLLVEEDGTLGIPERTAVQESWNAGVPYGQYKPDAGAVDRFERVAEVVLGGDAGA